METHTKPIKTCSRKSRNFGEIWQEFDNVLDPGQDDFWKKCLAALFPQSHLDQHRKKYAGQGRRREQRVLRHPSDGTRI